MEKAKSDSTVEAGPFGYQPVYLIDTSVILPCLWKATKPSHLKLLERLSEEEPPSISVISCFEVLAGTVQEYLEANRRFLNGFRMIEVTQEIADIAGRLYYRWAKKGSVLPSNDLLIGASAAAHGLILVTKNAKHFPYLKDLDEYEIEYQSRSGRKTTEVIHLLNEPRDLFLA